MKLLILAFTLLGSINSLYASHETVLNCRQLNPISWLEFTVFDDKKSGSSTLVMSEHDRLGNFKVRSKKEVFLSIGPFLSARYSNDAKDFYLETTYLKKNKMQGEGIHYKQNVEVKDLNCTTKKISQSYRDLLLSRVN